jgi:hypothetical protein
LPAAFGRKKEVDDLKPGRIAARDAGFDSGAFVVETASGDHEAGTRGTHPDVLLPITVPAPASRSPADQPPDGTATISFGHR